MISPQSKADVWQVDVKFQKKGVLHANASGLLLVPPEDVLSLVTDPAGDTLFRVVQRTALPLSAQGGKRVAVVNKAAIRVLAWKLWTNNHVEYEITAEPPREPPQTSCSADGQNSRCMCDTLAAAGPQQTCACDVGSAPDGRSVFFNLLSSNMLHSLSGTWSFQPVKLHHSVVYPTNTNKRDSRIHNNNHSKHSTMSARSIQPQLQTGLNLLVVDSSIAPSITPVINSHSSSSSSNSRTFKPLVDADGNITATLVRYEQLAQPKGLPPGVRFVPGMSDAVRMSIGREVRQMLDKIHYAANLELQHGLSPQEALAEMTQQLESAGGSFKKLTKQLQLDDTATVTGTHHSRRLCVKKQSVLGVGQEVFQLEVEPLQLQVPASP